MDWKHAVTSFLAGAVLLAAGALLFVRVLHSCVRGWQSRSWPDVEGHIDVARVDSGPAVEGGALYGIRLVYRYMVGGTSYVGTRLHFGDWVQLPVAWRARQDVDHLR